MAKIFAVGKIDGCFYTVSGPNGEQYRNVALQCVADESGFAVVRVIITKDSAGKVDVAWQHSDLTDGRMDTASYDLEYQEKLGFWAAVKEHIAQLAAGNFPPECVEYDF